MCLSSSLALEYNSKYIFFYFQTHKIPNIRSLLYCLVLFRDFFHILSMNSNLLNKDTKRECSPFGLALVALRTQKSISQSQFSILAKNNVTDLRRIEKGTEQPSITKAMHLVAALDVNCGTFFRKLAEDEGFLNQKILYKLQNEVNDSTVPNIENTIRNVFAQLKTNKYNQDLVEIKSFYGLFLGKLRRELKKSKPTKMSQEFLAENADYAIGNMYNLEKGQQDPNVMCALKMVCILTQNSENNIEIFFDALHELMQI